MRSAWRATIASTGRLVYKANSFLLLHVDRLGFGLSELLTLVLDGTVTAGYTNFGFRQLSVPRIPRLGPSFSQGRRRSSTTVRRLKGASPERDLNSCSKQS